MNQRLNEATLSLINVLSLTNGQLGIFSEDKMIDKKKIARTKSKCYQTE
jgi:hypothetical protein